METNVKTLYRADGPNTSKEAAVSLKVGKMEQLVLDTISSFKDRGCISDEVRDALPGYSYSAVTARYKALKDKNLIRIDTRVVKAASGRNQRVMWALKYYRPEEYLL